MFISHSICWNSFSYCPLIPHIKIKNITGTALQDEYPTSFLKMKVAQSCLTLCNPMDYTVRGILQVRILEWVAFPFPRGSSQLRDRTQVSRIAGGFFTSWATREAIPFEVQEFIQYSKKKKKKSFVCTCCQTGNGTG